MLFLAAITSSISMLQPVIAFLEEGLGLRRHASAAVLGLITALGTAFVVYFSKGLVALTVFDDWVGTLFIFILAMVQSVLYGWVFGIERGEEELKRGANIRIPRFVQWVLKYVTPVYLLAIFVGTCITSWPSYWKSLSAGGVSLLSLLFIGLIFAFLLLLVHIAGNRWEREGRLKF
jgi:SNF family Na+-dependent transporter